jgi:hypothetical protein
MKREVSGKCKKEIRKLPLPPNTKIERKVDKKAF